MDCRICGANRAHEIGEVEYYAGFAWTILECSACLCRFTKHDESTYSWLYSHSGSIYGIYRELADRARKLFVDNDVVGLKRELWVGSKYRFIIESVERHPRSSNLLEVGCSRGHLTSYFILAGYQITGADVSSEAIDAAREAFGDYFVLADSTEIHNRAPYDVIYHVGTIGCVNDPVGLTRRLLGLLKPGGQLLFNAPNADSCWLRTQLWIDAAPPPDVVTLFRPGFWRTHFSGMADVLEEVNMCPTEEGFAIGIRSLFGRKWQKPVPVSLDVSLDNYRVGRPQIDGASQGLWRIFERGTLKAGRLTHLLGVAPSQPSPFGLFVTMTRK